MNLQLSPYARRAAVSGAAATAFYAAMVFGSLADLEAVSGLKPFDMRPTGYGPDEARALLSSLGDAGRDTYLRHQLVLDTFYPALLAVNLSSLFRLVGRDSGARVAVQAGVIVSWCAAGFDYAENIGIAAMLALRDELPDALVTTTSLATVAKSASTSVAITALLGLLAWRVRRAWGANVRRLPKPAQ